MTTMKTTMKLSDELKKVMRDFVEEVVAEYYYDFYSHLYHRQIVNDFHNDLEVIYETLSRIKDDEFKADYIKVKLHEYVLKVDLKTEFREYMRHIVKEVNDYVANNGECYPNTIQHTLLKLQKKYEFSEIPQEIVDEVVDMYYPNVYDFMYHVIHETMCPYSRDEVEKILYFIETRIIEPYKLVIEPQKQSLVTQE